MEVVHSMYISSFMEKKAQLALHKRVIFIRGSFGGLITLRGVIVISSCLYFTLRTMFNSSLEGEFKNSIFFFQKSNFCISLPVLVMSFQLFSCYLHVSFFLSFALCLI